MWMVNGKCEAAYAFLLRGTMNEHRWSEWKRQRFVSIVHRFYIPLYGFSRSFTRKKQIWFSFIRKIIFSCRFFFFFVFASWLTFSVHRSSYSCFTTTVSFAFIPLSFFYVCELLLFVHKIRIHSIRIVCEIQYAAKNAYSMEKPRRKDKTSVVTRCSYENRNDQFSVWVKICQHRCEWMRNIAEYEHRKNELESKSQ